jgi:hypothetical protein
MKQRVDSNKTNFGTTNVDVIKKDRTDAWDVLYPVNGFVSRKVNISHRGYRILGCQ